MNIVHSGVDTLHIRIGFDGAAMPTKYALDLFREFELAKQSMGWETAPPIVQIGKATLIPFELQKSGKGKYRHVLLSPSLGAIKIWNREGWDTLAALQTGQLLIEFNSYYLITYGVVSAVRLAENLAAAMFRDGRRRHWLKISRMDICADVERDEPVSREELKKFKHRARDTKLYPHKETDRQSQDVPGRPPELDNKGGAKSHSWLSVVPDGEVSRHIDRPDTVYFGSFSSPLCARIYNKRLEARSDRKRHWEQIWEQNGARPDSEIFRVEFSARGELFKELDMLDEEFRLDPRHVLDCLGEVWAYLTRRWLVQVERASKGRDREAVLTEFWEAVASAQPDAPPPKRHWRPRPIVDQLRAQLKGVFTTIAAKLGRTKDYSAALVEWERLGDWVVSDEFCEKYDRRRDELGAINTNVSSNYLQHIRKTYESVPSSFAQMLKHQISKGAYAF